MGGVQLSVAEPLATASTVMLKDASEVVTRPSLTRIAMLAYVPTWLAAGVPCKRPVLVLKVAQAGAFTIENVNGSPSASVAAGWNEYGVPCITDVSGTPEITGARFAPVLTTIENGTRAAEA